jgi:hypothetical protein
LSSSTARSRTIWQPSPCPPPDTAPSPRRTASRPGQPGRLALCRAGYRARRAPCFLVSDAGCDRYFLRHMTLWLGFLRPEGLLVVTPTDSSGDPTGADVGYSPHRVPAPTAERPPSGPCAGPWRRCDAVEASLWPGGVRAVQGASWPPRDGDLRAVLRSAIGARAYSRAATGVDKSINVRRRRLASTAIFVLVMFYYYGLLRARASCRGTRLRQRNRCAASPRGQSERLGGRVHGHGRAKGIVPWTVAYRRGGRIGRAHCAISRRRWRGWRSTSRTEGSPPSSRQPTIRGATDCAVRLHHRYRSPSQRHQSFSLV